MLKSDMGKQCGQQDHISQPGDSESPWPRFCLLETHPTGAPILSFSRFRFHRQIRTRFFSRILKAASGFPIGSGLMRGGGRISFSSSSVIWL